LVSARIDNAGMPTAGRAFLVSQWQEAARDLSALGSPLLLAIIVVLAERKLWLGTLLGLAAIEAVGRLIKVLRFTRRPRPFAYETLLEKSDAGSFPSIHAARSAFVFLTMCVVSDEALARALCLALPVAVGVSRVILERHRWTDVAGGWTLGVLGAFALWWITA